MTDTALRATVEIENLPTLRDIQRTSSWPDAPRGSDSFSIIELVADHFGLYGRQLSSQTDLVTDLEADDIDRRELLVTAEELFGIRLTDSQMNTIRTIQDLIDAIKERKL